ncbi:putative transmembrane anti-sigma factor [Thermincola ferriacetica]|uniref:Anti-sigma-W factor RsiW n=1 Tax=Thermincola ferriacetica TaxID=281456 RepID=A0A0L6W4S8_9FIRM|nr:DUF4349 domain-containing protein [Thermincola ferriacetica]KNZ70383.1 putative transmembrane anti-sigma factor [Thermincola ferriacetica]
MECKDFRDLLSAYIDDVLDPSDKETVAQHLALCAGCRQELADLQKAVAVIKSLGEIAPPEHFREQLKVRLQAVQKEIGDEKRGMGSAKSRLSFIRDWKKSLKGWNFFRARWIVPAAVLLLGIGIGLVADKVMNQRGLYNISALPQMGGSKAKEYSLVTGAKDGQKAVTKESGSQERYKALHNEAVPTYGGPTGSGETNDKQVSMAESDKADILAAVPANNGGADIKSQAGTGVQQRQIIKNGWLTIKVQKFDKSVQDIGMLAESFGGYVENSEENNDGTKTGRFVVRVPVNKFATAIAEFEKLGQVVSKRLAGEDVSIEYRDAGARLRNLRRQESRLLTLVDKAASLSDVLALENELTRVRQEIESIEVRINYLGNVTEMATIHLEVREAGDKNAPDSQGVVKRAWNAFVESCRDLLRLLERLIVLLGSVLPYLIVIIGGLLMFRYFKKSKQ